MNKLFLVEEHVFCTAKANTFCAEIKCTLCIFRLLCIGSNLVSLNIAANCLMAYIIAPFKECTHVLGNFRSYQFHFVFVYFTWSTVNCDPVAFLECFAANNYFIIALQDNILGANYTRCSHSAGNNCRMACHTACRCKNTLRYNHSANIFGGSFFAYHKYFFAPCVPCFGFFCCVNNSAGSGSRRCVKAFCKGFCFFFSLCVDHWVKKLVKVLLCYAHNSGIFVD